jgi:N-acetyl-gamma-glutamyl-phosphate reductase
MPSRRRWRGSGDRSVSKAPKRVVVAGASGFAGALAASLVHRHPRLDLSAATARADAGKRLDRLYPRYRVPIELTELDLDRVADCDGAIVAYPHGAAAGVVARFVEAGVPVVDVSADFRLHDRAVYEETYGEHAAPDLLGDAVYGLTELHRDEIRSARLVANPGCYPTAAILALAPLAEAGLAEDVVISAASGVSGAGRDGGDRLHFVTVDENFAPYGVEGHRHLPEVVQELGELGGDGRITFVPHLVPLDQGLLTSCFVSAERDVKAQELRRLYGDRYGGEAFIEVVDDPPGVREVRDTNLCRIHVSVDERTGRAMAFAAIDNLWKGAAGQAIQNLNLMLGLEETDGLV